MFSFLTGLEAVKAFDNNERNVQAHFAMLHVQQVLMFIGVDDR